MEDSVEQLKKAHENLCGCSCFCFQMILNSSFNTPSQAKEKQVYNNSYNFRPEITTSLLRKNIEIIGWTTA
jgi:hypothetical protein